MRRVIGSAIAVVIGILLLAPDPHDHGDALSIGGLLRPLLPASAAHRPPAHPDKASDEPSRAETDRTCPIHVWNQLVATGLVLAICLTILLESERRFVRAVPPSRYILFVAVHSRAPPLL